MAEINRRNAGGAREYITFRIGAQDFCVDIMSVREIRGWTPATALPHAPGYVRGVINLRGVVLPIIDLADRLGFPPTEPTARHVIIVAQVGAPDRRPAGRRGLRHHRPDRPRTIQPTPDVACDGVKAFVRGMMAIDDRMISLIALDSVMPTRVGEAA